jgi:hypothetical protein
LHYACYLSPLLKSNVDFLWIPVHTWALPSIRVKISVNPP